MIGPLPGNALSRACSPMLRAIGWSRRAFTRLVGMAGLNGPAVARLSAILVAIGVSWACGSRQTSKQDSCSVMVQRQLACLELDKAGSGFFGRERVEEALMDRKQAIRLCREALATTPSVAHRLTRCLRFRDCERLGACYEDLFVLTSVRRVLGLASGRDVVASPSALNTLSVLCADHYITGRLARMADPDARALSKRLGSVCREVAQTKVDRVSNHINRLVRDRLGHKVVSGAGGGLTLRGICGDVQHKPTEKHLPGADSATPSDRTSPVVEPAQSAALRAICREPWRLRSLLNRSRKLGDILDRASDSPAGLERGFKLCRAAGAVAGPLLHVGLPSVEQSASALLRRCRVELPATWVFVRLGPLDVAEGAADQGTPRRSQRRVGRWTCLRARTIVARMERGYATDPLTHLATALVQARCSRWMRRRSHSRLRTRGRRLRGR